MSTSEKPKPVITGDSQAQGIAKFRLQDNLRGPHSRAAGAPQSERARFFGVRHQRPRSTPNRGVSGTGKTVRRFGRSMHFDRRRES